MAEGLLRRALRERAIEGVRVESSGVSGWDGSPATPEAVEAVAEYGLDISGHQARRLTRAMAEPADLVVAMSSEHRDGVSRLVPQAGGRTFTIKELVYLLESEPGGETEGTTVQQLRAAVDRAAAIRKASPGMELLDEDIADPLGLGLESYRATAWELESLTARLADALFPEAGRREASMAEEGESLWGTRSPEGGA
jgi:protein arginine phosphatase